MQVVGRRMGEVAGLVSSLVMCLKSLGMVHRGCVACTGTYLLRNLWQRRVILPDPSTCNYILVKLTDLNDDACFVPLVGIWTCLVLNTYMAADCKRW